jgi:hypothetical protein
VLGQYLIARDNKRKSDTERAVREAKIDMRLDNLESKFDEAIARIDEHNGLADRFKDACNSFNVIIAELRTELNMMKER